MAQRGRRRYHSRSPDSSRLRPAERRVGGFLQPDVGDPPVTDSAILVLEDGTVFEGISVGAPGLSVGEVVFNTAMTG
ncbi:MAG TPA: carbamoyl-phosphate synthase domain-containing protein, partial [Luteimonas sp.]|nr:carbamoyl-phosphate synthase domain-containing protein [Luteimonas sp.]